MKKLIMGIFALVMCLSTFKANAQLSRFLNEQQIERLNSTIVRDENSNVISFDYKDIQNEVGEDKLIGVIFELTKVKLLYYYSNECGKAGAYTYNTETGTVENATNERAEELQEELAGGVLVGTAYPDKKNWRRPGCKPKVNAICVLYL